MLSPRWKSLSMPMEHSAWSTNISEIAVASAAKKLFRFNASNMIRAYRGVVGARMLIFAHRHSHTLCVAHRISNVVVAPSQWNKRIQYGINYYYWAVSKNHRPISSTICARQWKIQTQSTYVHRTMYICIKLRVYQWKIYSAVFRSNLIQIDISLDDKNRGAAHQECLIEK